MRYYLVVWYIIRFVRLRIIMHNLPTPKAMTSNRKKKRLTLNTP